MMTDVFTDKKVLSFARVLCGASLLALASCVKIPFYPISFTLHTFALFLISLRFSPKEAMASAALYLLLGSAGLPVFSGVANLDWMSGRAAGYLLAFPLSAYCIAKLKDHMPSLLAIGLGSAIYFFSGCLWLSSFVGGSVAFVKGVLVFLPSEVCKALAATLWISWKDQK